MSTKEKRKKIENLVLTFMSKIDKTGKNRDKYKHFFASLDDKNFKIWIENFLNDPRQYFQIEVLPFEDPSIDDIKEALDYLGVPMEEYVYYRHDGYKEDHLRTKTKVPVGYLHIKRVQQLLRKKNKFGLEITDVSPATGEHRGDSKGARNSDWETLALSTIGADKALEELLGPRADNRQKKLQMYQAISRDGYVKLQDLKSDPTSNLALNMLDTYLTAAGIKTDLITPTLRTYATIQKELREKNNK